MDRINAQIKIDLQKRIGKINPNIFGGFVEFIRDCVNPGIQAQVLTDRSFETVGDTEQPLKYWRCERINDTCVISVKEHTDKPGKYVELNTIDHFGGYVAVYQRNCRFIPDTRYVVSLRVYTDEQFCGKVSCKILSENNTYTLPLTFQAGAWVQTSTILRSINDREATVAFVVEGEGVVQMDDASIYPAETVNGVWPEVVERVKSLKCGILRFPGGCFADVYDWRDGIGSERVFKENLHWGGMEDNSFGTDEFMVFCKNVCCEPMMCINFGSGTPELAASWVEYCNGSVETEYGAMRAKNGHPEPYGVHYWEIGNENYGDWEVGNCDAETFSQRFAEFANAMKTVDPSIDIIACGTNEYDAPMDWNDQLMELPIKPDVLALHLYSPQCRDQIPQGDDIYYATVGASVKFERIIQDAARQMQAAGVPARIAVSEWNAMYITSSYRERTMEAAVFNACLMLSFMRCGDVVEIANFSDLVNGWEGACIVNDYGEVYSTPSYYAIKLFSNAESKCALKTEVESERYFVKQVGHIRDITVSYIDALACAADHGINILVVNRDKNRCAEVQFVGEGISEYLLKSHKMISGTAYERNTYKQERCTIKDIAVPSGKTVIVPPCSVNLFYAEKEETS